MFAQFYFRKWNPPNLSEEQQRSLGFSVAQCGIPLLTSRLVRLPIPLVISSGVTKKQIWDYWAVLAAYAAIGATGGICAQWGNSVGNRSMERFGAGLFAIGFLGSVVFLASVVLVACQYSWWLRGLRLKALKGEI